MTCLNVFCWSEILCCNLIFSDQKTRPTNIYNDYTQPCLPFQTNGWGCCPDGRAGYAQVGSGCKWEGKVQIGKWAVLYYQSAILLIYSKEGHRMTETTDLLNCEGTVFILQCFTAWYLVYWRAVSNSSFSSANWKLLDSRPFCTHGQQENKNKEPRLAMEAAVVLRCLPSRSPIDRSRGEARRESTGWGWGGRQSAEQWAHNPGTLHVLRAPNAQVVEFRRRKAFLKWGVIFKPLSGHCRTATSTYLQNNLKIQAPNWCISWVHFKEVVLVLLLTRKRRSSSLYSLQFQGF